MSFEVKLFSYFQGHFSGGVRRAMLQGLLPVPAESAKANTWDLSYGMQRCRVELTPSAYDDNTIGKLSFSGDSRDPELWTAIVRIMQRENFVSLVEGESFIACEATRKHLPTQLQDASMVRDGEELLNAVMRDSGAVMEAAS